MNMLVFRKRRTNKTTYVPLLQRSKWSMTFTGSTQSAPPLPCINLAVIQDLSILMAFCYDYLIVIISLIIICTFWIIVRLPKYMPLCFRYVTYISDRYGSHITTPDNCVCTGRNHLDTYKHYDDDSKIYANPFRHHLI